MKIKVCGLKYKDNIEQIAALQFDYMGFIFYPKSKRFVGEDFEMPVINKNVKKVGVFVNAEPDYILNKINKYNLDAIQLHGDETAGYCSTVKELLLKNENTKNIELIKAFGVDESFDFEKLTPYCNSCDYFLFDTKTKEYGGSGNQFNWKILGNYTNAIPYFLSGGIGIEDIEKIKKGSIKLNPYAIDVNSKFELEPGLKDIELVTQLKN